MIFKDYEEVKNFWKSPIRDLYKYSDIQKEFAEMFHRMDRHLNEISFVKCEDPTFVLRAFVSATFKYFLKTWGMEVRAPSTSQENEGNHKTFLKEYLNNNPEHGHAGHPSAAQPDDLGACTFCSSYSFTSQTEKARHTSVFHRRQKKASKGENSHVCNFAGCGQCFRSLVTLNRHKMKSGHTARDIRGKNPSDKTKKQKRRQQKR